ncbi:hypothetical protein PV08_11007 [Exophiala spinifera]|uniref:Muconate cycloisomerase 1 n=1 Tax=Exophiala spinifera TaxID=91928 RepID=A0A0D2AZ12_9EURO|nr:uncharacterized protein PV08_11007 [Exophiala spinifera]KIW11705.1 hypothetical protein PV08_11007 [Exophiala spinifera]
MSQPQSFDFLVGTFNTPQLYTLRFTPASESPSSSSSGTLKIVQRSFAIGSHSWLHLTPPRPDGTTRTLYATAWTEPPTVVAYAVHSPTQISLLGTARTQSRSGYVCASDVAVYSAGGATGEVFVIDRETGGFLQSADTAAATTHSTTPAPPLQTISFLDASSQRDDGSVMDFGGLRHGAHSADLSPDQRALYVADIGRNCIWTFSLSPLDGRTTLGEKHISPRPNDGPRHVWPHPSGRYVYCLQEHTSMVDVFSTSDDGVTLKHEQGVRIIPAGEDEGEFWADEVRTSLSHGSSPRYLYASTRGLENGKKGYVAVYKLTEEGRIDEDNNSCSESTNNHHRVSSSSTTNGGTTTAAATTTTTSHTNGNVNDTANGNSDAHRNTNVAASTNGASVNFHLDANANTKASNDPYAGLQCMYQTATSGGWANAIQPGPTVDGIEYLALTDSEEGFVFVLSWDGSEIREVARTKLDEGAGAATAVWCC